MDQTNALIREVLQTFSAMGEVEEMVLDVFADGDVLARVVEIGLRVEECCERYASETDHTYPWVMKKAQEAAVSRLTKALETGMGGYCG